MKENESLLNTGSLYTRLSYLSGEHDLGNHSLVINSPNKDTLFSFTFFQDYKVHYALNEYGGFKWDYQITTKDNDLVIGQNYDSLKYNIPYLIEYFKARLNNFLKNHNTNNKFQIRDTDKIYKLNNRLARIYKKTGDSSIDTDTSNYSHLGGLDIMLSYHFSEITPLKIPATIIKELAKLNRSDLRGFRSRFDLTLKRAKAQEFDIPYRMTSLNSNCGFVFIPIEFNKKSKWGNALRNFSLIHKYEQKLDKVVGMISYYNPQEKYHDIYWSYIDSKWEYDVEFEKIIADNFPLRPVKAEKTFRYYLKN